MKELSNGVQRWKNKNKAFVVSSKMHSKAEARNKHSKMHTIMSKAMVKWSGVNKKSAGIKCGL